MRRYRVQPCVEIAVEIRDELFLIFGIIGLFASCRFVDSVLIRENIAVSLRNIVEARRWMSAYHVHDCGCNDTSQTEQGNIHGDLAWLSRWLFEVCLWVSGVPEFVVDVQRVVHVEADGFRIICECSFNGRRLEATHSSSRMDKVLPIPAQHSLSRKTRFQKARLYSSASETELHRCRPTRVCIPISCETNRAKSRFLKGVPKISSHSRSHSSSPFRQRPTPWRSPHSLAGRPRKAKAATINE